MDEQGACDLHGFDVVFQKEAIEVAKRRECAGYDSESINSGGLVGLALSGGGIRSATFCLGLLQDLHHLGLLRIFDYLSTVSGGGYVGGWWSAWLARPLLGTEDLTNPRSFVDRIKDDSNTSVKLRKYLSKQVQKLLSDDDAQKEPSDQLLNELLYGLTGLLHDRRTRERCFAEQELSPETGELFNKAERSAQYFWANRALLESAYPNEITCGFFPRDEQDELTRSRRRLHGHPATSGLTPSPEGSQGNRSPSGASNSIAPALTQPEKLEPESALNANVDPIHHLRLFANYLTPRRGLLSQDTWRAVAFITRNIMMTWLVLPPVLVALVLIGQLFYVAHPDPRANFIDYPIGASAWIAHWGALKTRFLFALEPLIAIAGWVALMGVLWLLATFQTKRKSDWNVVIICVVSVGAVILCAVSADPSFLRVLRTWVFKYPALRVGWLIVALALTTRVLWTTDYEGADGDKESIRDWKWELIRTKITLMHAKLLVAFVVTAVVLGISGFGHEVIDYQYSNLAPYLGIPLGTSGGLFALIGALFGVIFTAYRATPRGGGDKRDSGEPSRASRFIFAVTPPLVVLVVAFGAACIGHKALVFISAQPGIAPLMYLEYAIFFGIAVSLILAMFEMDLPASRRPFWLYASLIAPAFASLVVLIRLFGQGEQIPRITNYLLYVFALTVFFVGVAYVFSRIVVVKGEDTNPDACGFDSRLKRLRDTLKSPAFYREAVRKVLPLSVFACWAFYEESTFEGNRSDAPGIVFSRGSLLIVAIVAGVSILHRLTLVPTRPEEQGRFRDFQPAISRRWARGRDETDTVWLVGSALVVIAVAATCAAHALIASHDTVSIGLQTTVVENWNQVEILIERLFSVEGTTAPLVALPIATSVLVIGIYLCKKTWGLVRKEDIPTQLVESAREGPVSSRVEQRLKPYGFVLFSLLAFACLVIGAFCLWMAGEAFDHLASEVKSYQKSLTSLTLAGVVLCLAFTRIELNWARGENRRSLWLLGSAYVALIVLMVVSFMEPLKISENTKYEFAVFGLVATAATWVMALGWMADPNAFSMHAFYRARLVRAYLGASNSNRRVHEKQITEAAAGDDVLLQDLKNCDRGAPYHLINTTLNLVACRDLALAQRSAASFTLSKLYCGSLHTGYRCTEKYMNGRVSLGSGVAISGAAASPNMGSRTPGPALAMLLTLLNVRLGYWAPTPNKKDWNSPQARLWPLYLMREFLSQTNDLSGYCYLTDGGHFENTGLYSLVQRGCRFIVVADCGADPLTCFGDLGDAIRRCRIDFGADIDVDIEEFVKYEKEYVEKPVKRHFVAGTIKYSPEHLKKLSPGKSHNLDKLDGVIILIKPSLTSKDRADIRQYAIENADFPQTSTAKQFFDEAQFESYRRLGELCLNNVFEFVPRDGSAGLKRTLKTLEAARTDRQPELSDKTNEQSINQIRASDIEALFRRVLASQTISERGLLSAVF